MAVGEKQYWGGMDEGNKETGCLAAPGRGSKSQIRPSFVGCTACTRVIVYVPSYTHNIAQPVLTLPCFNSSKCRCGAISEEKT